MRSSRPATTVPLAVASIVSMQACATAADTGITTAITARARRYTPR
nr:MAG TPA: hypothetical protein [Caudoviricetes sp.]